ncbi:SPOR domain-containing protein [Gelidibacter maritimus]|uniref:SPOR domain-containing protein n=1 Tax=Gelidibacter maritimus TaxID=2761487 RepID=A0A7W2M3W3_9FLAO|nr:SPOR domain-containing protein [Gelidibacter maritimus]MBA6152227.1 SPOR domain-containing protein [Gelidibacter maritimus]
MIKPILKSAILGLALCAIPVASIAQEGMVTIDQDKEIDRLLEFKRDAQATVDAFVIQVYNGSRGGAQTIKSDISNLFPDWSNSIEYESPNYKIWLGNFRTRLEADRALMTVKKTYPDALVLRPKKNR